MRKYIIVFMEQRMGVKRLTQIPGPEGEAWFESRDDDDALAYVSAHFLQQVRTCVRAELTSMAIVPSNPGAPPRLVDDSLENPHFHEFYIRYNSRTKLLEVDFESTVTGLVNA
ncbi:MAG TPA: hypothetical protein VGE92_12630 [Steroidobacteraceae bacterium]|jgi:hypothetical protein